VRRDLDILASRGLIRKVHGGAVSPHDRSTDEPGFEANSLLREAEKRAIATAAAAYIEPGMAVGLAAGTTTWALAQSLRDIVPLTIVTNSIRVADVFHQQPRADQTVVLTGGIRTPSDALVGPVAVQALQGLHLDIAVLGAHGMNVRAGFTTPNMMEAETNRTFISSAVDTMVVSDHTKWGVVGFSTYARLDEVSVLVTDSALAPEARALLAERVGEVVTATPSEAPTTDIDKVQ
jgi:DeoR/GlpR family transcriptional regulator of sugar metabolism